MPKTHVVKSWFGELKSSTIGLAVFIGLGAPLLVLLADRSITTRDLVSTSTVEMPDVHAVAGHDPVAGIPMVDSIQIQDVEDRASGKLRIEAGQRF